MPGIVEVGEVSTLAGSTQGFADGVGSTAQFSSPKGVAVDSAGIVYVADTNNHKIRKILPDGTVSTLAGSTQGYADGVGAAAQFSHPEYIAVTGDGIVYVLKSDYEPPWCIRKILPNGTVSTLVRLERPPQSIALDSNGHIYFGQDGRMKKILPDGTIILLREIPYKSRLTIGHDGIIYIVDIKDNEIVKILKDGTKHTLVSVDTNFVGGPIAVQRIFDPHSITVDNTGNLYITDSNRIRKIAPDGTLTTLAGMKKGFTDGRGSEARFSSPQGIAVDSTGVVYIADTSNNRIRKMVIGRFEGTNENVPPSAPSGFGSSARSAATSARSAASGFGSSGSSGSSGFGPSGFSGFGPSASSPSAPSAPSAPSGSSVAAYSNFEGNGLSSETRGRLWWQLNQMTCPTREADSHIPFVKAQLNLLYKTAVKTVDSYTDKTTPDQMKIYQEYLRNIFTGVQASFTSLNNTSVKCAMLFTKMLVDHPLPDGLKERDLYSERGEYWDVNWDKPHTTPLAQRQLRGLVFQDEHPGCIPNCKNKGIVVLLGEMSLYELIWSYANDLYFIGLPTGITYADNDVHTPLTFVEHDCEHMEHRADIDEVFSHPSFVPEFKRAELQRRKDRAKENKNILKCLQYIRDKSKNTQDAVLLFLFVIVHEQNTQDILDDHVSLELFPVGLLQSISNRLQWKNDMGGLLPPEFKKPDDESNDDESNDDEDDDESDDDEAELDAAVLTWVKAQLVIFVDTWNASLASDAVAINERPNANTVARYDARTKANAAEWNARGGRITRRKRTARRKTQKHRRVTN